MDVLILLDADGKKVLEYPYIDSRDEDGDWDDFDNQLFAVDITETSDLGNIIKRRLLYKAGEYIGVVTCLNKKAKYKNEFYYNGFLVQKLKAQDSIPIIFEKEAAGFIKYNGDKDTPWD